MNKLDHWLPLLPFVAGVCHQIWPNGWRTFYAAFSQTAWEHRKWAGASDTIVRLWGCGLIVIGLTFALFGWSQ